MSFRLPFSEISSLFTYLLSMHFSIDLFKSLEQDGSDILSIYF
jgi:hypothetical protein